MEPTNQPSSDITTGPQAEIAPEGGAASSEPTGGWLSRAVRAVVGRNDLGESAARTQADAEHPPEGNSTEAEPWSPPSWTTKQDYDQWLQSQQQSFADRRDRTREQRAVADQARERDSRVAELEQEKAQAREQGDTWTVGEKQDEIDALKAGVSREQVQSGALSEFIGALRAENDAVTLDPLLAMLPQATAKKLIDEASMRDEHGALVMASDGLPVGVLTAEARGQLHAAGLKALVAQAKAEGRAEARKDPVFRKEMMAGFQATPEAEEQTPVMVSSAPNGAAPADMNSFLRSVTSRGPAHT